jgi:O-methyltransferase
MLKKIIMFGASEGSILIKKTLIKEFKVIAVCDNNSELVGKKLDDIPIVSPTSINKIDYDYIIITNIHGEEIKKQLYSLNVPLNKIIDYFYGKMFDNRLGVLRLISEQIYEKELQGDVAELGVYRGDFAFYINQIFWDKQCYLFDTFEGFCEKDCFIEQNNNYSDVTIEHFSDTNLDKVIGQMENLNKINICKGYFPETAEGLEDKTYCFVSLDADLYKPTYDGLSYFYPRLVNGGYIIIHDYNSTKYNGTKKAVDKYCREYKISVVPIIDNCGSAIIVK